MSRMLRHHQELNELGEGKCSVPQFWGWGGEAGFCDNRAFGNRPSGQTIRRWDGFEYRKDGLYAGYVPGLACPIHGGPKIRYCMDGNMWCATRADFINLQESNAGFGETKEAALVDLEIQEKP